MPFGEIEKTYHEADIIMDVVFDVSAYHTQPWHGEEVVVQRIDNPKQHDVEDNISK